MCGGVHYGEVEGLVSVERFFMCGVHYGEIEGLVSVERWSCSRGVLHVWWSTLAMGRLRDWFL